MRRSFFTTAIVLLCLACSGHAFAQDKPEATEKIAANDLLRVQVSDAPEFTRALRVIREHLISDPFVTVTIGKP
jgi:hypothetical protein